MRLQFPNMLMAFVGTVDYLMMGYGMFVWFRLVCVLGTMRKLELRSLTRGDAIAKFFSVLRMDNKVHT
jgi:hypothetical protein